MKARVATVLVVLLSLVACGTPNRLTSGTIVNMHYDDQDIIEHPGYWQDGGETCTGGYGSTPRTCYQNPDYWVPGYTEVQPPHWSVQVKGRADGKELKEWHTVSEQDYACLKIGDWWVKDRDPCIPR